MRSAGLQDNVAARQARLVGLKERGAMRYVVLAMIMLLGTSATPAGNSDEPLPELHKIKQITLSPSYSCRSREDSQKGYERTALFLSTPGNGPDLLFNGACGAPDQLDVSTAGDDMSMIGDLGKIRLEDLRTDQAFNVKRVNSPELYTKFVSTIPVEFGHTYVVLINKSHVRGLLYFTVTGYIPNQRLDLRYAVKEYQLLSVRAQSPGFDWNQKNY